MKVRIVDKDALRAVTPEALAGCAATLGWQPEGTYRTNSRIWVSEDHTEIIVSLRGSPLRRIRA